jgi:hypothetical protein
MARETPKASRKKKEAIRIFIVLPFNLVKCRKEALRKI